MPLSSGNTGNSNSNNNATDSNNHNVKKNKNDDTDLVATTTADRHMNDSTMPPPRLSFSSNKTTTTTTTTTTTSAASRPGPPPKGPVRVKKGFGLADWTQLVKVSKDLAQKGVNTPLRSHISRQEVAQHNTIHDGWMIVHNKVYNIVPYLAYHPGGAGILKSSLGKDATALFEKYHRWVNVDGLIGVLLLGYLDVRPTTTSTTMEVDAASSSYVPGMTTRPTHDADGFALPAPPSPTTTASQRKNINNNLLPTKLSDEEEEDDMDPLGF